MKTFKVGNHSEDSKRKVTSFFYKKEIEGNEK